MASLERLERSLGYTFNDRSLLETALAHRSMGSSNNERLEFLGDSVLNHIVAEHLFLQFPRAREGELSRMRAALVKGDTLAEVARELELGEYLRLGPGERKSGGRRRDSILADTVEALLGAVLLETGLDTCRDLVNRLLAQRFAVLTEDAGVDKDAKTQLQEYLQARSLPLPEYRLAETGGSEHAREFVVACCLDNPRLETRGRGSSLRRAEQAAAGLALEDLEHD